MYRGILYLILATLLFSLVNLGVKFLDKPTFLNPNPQNFPVYELVFFRSLIALVISITVVKIRKIPLLGNNKKWLVIRGLSGATALYLFFITIQNLPFAIATAVQYLSPVFTVIIAIFLLKEKVAVIQWLFFIISLSGVFVIGYDPDQKIDFVWIIVGVISALFSGFAYNAIMKCKHTDEPVTVVMYFPLLATPITLIMCITGDFIMPRGIEWIILLLMGILTQMAQVCMTRAFNADSASTVAPLKYLGAIYAAVTGFLFFGEILQTATYIGIALIILGVLLNTWFKKRKSIKLQNA